MVKKSLWSRFLSISLELLRSLAIVFLFAFIIRYFLVQPFIVEGSSMEPNFHNREFILINKIVYQLHGPKRFDVVVFRNPRDPSVFFIKRIIGLPGENVKIEDDHIYINGKILSENFSLTQADTLVSDSQLNVLDLTLGQNEYFVMGDNRDESLDSRELGPLKKINIVGKFWFALYPLSFNRSSASP